MRYQVMVEVYNETDLGKVMSAVTDIKKKRIELNKIEDMPPGVKQTAALTREGMTMGEFILRFIASRNVPSATIQEIRAAVKESGRKEDGANPTISSLKEKGLVRKNGPARYGITVKAKALLNKGDK